MKRLLMVLMSLVLLAGCGGGGGGSSSSPAPATPTTPTTAADTLTFWADDFTTNSYYQTTATKMAEGTHCYIYLEQGATATTAQINAVIAQFDTTVYPKDNAAFGSEPNPGADGDPKVYILLLNVRDGFNAVTSTSYVAGYFDPLNEYPNSVTHSNQKELLYMNVNAAVVTPADTEFNTTMAHEFQHMIHWEQKEHRLGKSDDTWLDEGMATVAGDICGYGPDYATVDTYERASGHSLTVWEGSAANYGVVYMWSQYFQDQFGAGKIFYSMLHNNDTGITEVNTALAAAGTGKTFTSAFRDWALALYFGNGTTVAAPAGHPEWTYTSINTWPGYYANNTVRLPGLFTTTNPTSLAALQAWGLGFAGFTPVSGTAGTVTWTPATANEKAWLVDAGSGQVIDLTAGVPAPYTTKGYLIAQNLAGSAAGSGASVTRTAMVSAFPAVTALAAASAVPAVSTVRTAREVLAEVNGDPQLQAQVQETGRPLHVCIDATLHQQEDALRAQGLRPAF